MMLIGKPVECKGLIQYYGNNEVIHVIMMMEKDQH